MIQKKNYLQGKFPKTKSRRWHTQLHRTQDIPPSFLKHFLLYIYLHVINTAAVYTCVGSLNIEVVPRAQPLILFFNYTLHSFKYH